jgi:hypothetical protein
MTYASPSRFAASEHGAVTVDWVVLSAATVGLGLATMAIIGGGVRDLTNQVGVFLETAPVHKVFANSDDCDFDTEGACQAGSANIVEVSSDVIRDVGDEFGNALVIASPSTGRETAQMTLDFKGFPDVVDVQFDMLAMDSLDNSSQHGRDEGGIVYYDGEPVGRLYRDWEAEGGFRWETYDVEGVTLTGGTPEARSSDRAGVDGQFASDDSRSWDSVVPVTMRIEKPGPQGVIGFGAVANQGQSDEAIGVDNVTVSHGGF